MAHLLAFAGVCLWMLSIAIVVQRQRVLARRLARLERAAGLRRRPPHDDLLSVLAPRVAAKGHVRVGPPPPTSDRVPKPPPPASRTLPTVQKLAALARPLQRAGG